MNRQSCLSLSLFVDCLSVSLALSCVLLLSQKLSLLELRHAVQLLRSSEARLASQKALLDAKMAAAAASPPPPPPAPALPYEDDARSIGSTVLLIDLYSDRLTFQNKSGTFNFMMI